MENKENIIKLSNQLTPDECNLVSKISKNDLSDSSLGENFFNNISTKTRSDQKNKNANYFPNLKETKLIPYVERLILVWKLTQMIQKI